MLSQDCYLLKLTFELWILLYRHFRRSIQVLSTLARVTVACVDAERPLSFTELRPSYRITYWEIIERQRMPCVFSMIAELLMTPDIDVNVNNAGHGLHTQKSTQGSRDAEK